jgi:CBS-domain-containing membrane protein
VSLAIAAMHLTKSLHPPGGATALIAILGPQEIYDQGTRHTARTHLHFFFLNMSGFWYVLMPGLVSSVILVAEAVIIDNVSHLMSYPIHWLW